ncbi:hypothetical protein [Streptomyces sp. NPDC091268]|uniref:hypothetical protein n=1 Tax=Streptomyces sp. NPDC091268 TaxID=3365979 RepID=UPI0037F1ED48
MLPPRLLWRDPRPVPRFNRQEPVTVIVRDPGLYEPTDEDECRSVWYFCRTHGAVLGGPCGQGDHLVASHCEEHGPENVWPQPLMLLFPEGFDPPLSEAQLAWVRAEYDTP